MSSFKGGINIIIVGPAYPMRGGIAHYGALLFKELSKINNVKFYSFKRQYPEFLFPGKTQFETGEPALKVPDEKNIVTIDSINPINWIITGLKIRSKKPNLIIFKYWIPFFAIQYAVISFVAKIFSNSKILFICHNIIPHEKRFGDNLLTKITFYFVDYFLVQSKTVENELRLFNKKNKPYILTPHPIYNIFGDSIEKLSALNYLKDKYKINLKSKKILLFFGYIRKYKGLMNAINAIGELRKNFSDIVLLVAGEFYENSEPYYRRISELQIENNIKIISDFIPDEDVKYFFSSSDAVLLPYSSASQSGIVQIAYHFEKPVIASDISGIAEVITNEKTGLLVPPDDSFALAQAIIKYYTENLEYSIKNNIISEKEKYSWETYVNNIYKLINSKNNEI